MYWNNFIFVFIMEMCYCLFLSKRKAERLEENVEFKFIYRFCSSSRGQHGEQQERVWSYWNCVSEIVIKLSDWVMLVSFDDISEGLLALENFKVEYNSDSLVITVVVWIKFLWSFLQRNIQCKLLIMIPKWCLYGRSQWVVFKMIKSKILLLEWCTTFTQLNAVAFTKFLLFLM